MRYESGGRWEVGGGWSKGRDEGRLTKPEGLVSLVQAY